MPRASIPDKIYLYLYFTLIFYTFLTCISPPLNSAVLIPLRCLHPGTSLRALRVGKQTFYQRLILISPVNWFCGGAAAAGAVRFLPQASCGAAWQPLSMLAGQPSSSVQPCTCENCATETSCPLCFCESKERGLVPKAVHRREKGEWGVPAENLSHFTAAM